MFYRSKNLLTLAQCPSWVVVTPDRQRRDTEGFVDLIMKTGSGVGFKLPRPEIGMFVLIVLLRNHTLIWLYPQKYCFVCIVSTIIFNNHHRITQINVFDFFINVEKNFKKTNMKIIEYVIPNLPGMVFYKCIVSQA